MATNKLFKYIGKEYWMPSRSVDGLLECCMLFGFNPIAGNVILDVNNGEDMFEVPIDKFPFENYIREEN